MESVSFRQPERPQESGQAFIAELRRLFSAFDLARHDEGVLTSLKRDVRKFAASVHPDRHPGDVASQDLSKLANTLLDACADPARLQGRQFVHFDEGLRRLEGHMPPTEKPVRPAGPRRHEKEDVDETKVAEMMPVVEELERKIDGLLDERYWYFSSYGLQDYLMDAFEAIAKERGVAVDDIASWFDLQTTTTYSNPFRDDPSSGKEDGVMTLNGRRLLIYSVSGEGIGMHILRFETRTLAEELAKRFG
ncbi:hypothetical protein L0Y59_04590 [Candidatus Uhrbacteria bacterium]|nr:hypothetical protein [Candidatus Uhrbacteria bacterium]